MREVASAKSRFELPHTTLASIAMLSVTANTRDAADDSSSMVDSSKPSNTELDREAGTVLRWASSDMATLRSLDTDCAADCCCDTGMMLYLMSGIR